MTRIWSPTAQAAAGSGVPAKVIVDRPLARAIQSTDGLLDPIKEAGFFVMGANADVDNYIGTSSVDSASCTRVSERKKLPLPSTRGAIEYPFVTRPVKDFFWRGEPQSTTEMHRGMQFRLSRARDTFDPAGKILPETLPSRAIGEGDISIVYLGNEGAVLKFAESNFSAERLHVVHAGLHVFGISHLEIRTDGLALDVARNYGIVEQRMLPPGSMQLREVARGHDELNEAAFSAVGNKLGKDARDELEELAGHVWEINDDGLLHNESFFRGYSMLDALAMYRSDRYRTFVCDAFMGEEWNMNVFFNEDPSMRWFLLDW